MKRQSLFYNISLSEDITNGVFPLKRYHFYGQKVENGIFELIIYPASVERFSPTLTAEIKSYSYMKRAEVIQDLESWAMLNSTSLMAIVSEKMAAESPALKMTLEADRDMPKDLAEISNCIGFWNREGLSIYENNIYGKLGNPTTQEQARKTAFDHWLLNAILIDCQVFIKPHGTKYKTGRGGHHVWITEGDERFVMIHL